MLSKLKKSLFGIILGVGRGKIATLKSLKGELGVARRLFCASRTAFLLCKVAEEL